jgi:hypothetical protein
MNENILKSLALLIGGALIGAIAGLLVSWIGSRPVITVIIATMAITFIAYGLSCLLKLWHWCNIRKRKRFLKIGILNDIPQNEEEGWVHTNVCQEKWKDEIERQIKNKKIEVKLIKVKEIFDPYTAIINPYGGVYPERDLGKLETLNKVRDYVAEGGLFINVADIPGYFAYNELLKRKLDITPPALWAIRPDGKIEPIRPFDRTPLMEKVGLRTYSVNETWDIEFEDRFKDILGLGIKGTKVCRVVVVEKNVKSVVKQIEEEKRTPIFFVEYGNGEFLFSLIWIGVDENGIDEQEKSVKEKLVTALAKLIVHVTQLKGSKYTTK